MIGFHVLTIMYNKKQLRLNVVDWGSTQYLTHQLWEKYLPEFLHTVYFTTIMKTQNDWIRPWI